MSGAEQIRILAAEISRSRQVLDRIEQYYDEYSTSSIEDSNPTRENAIVVAEILVNYYACLETIFLRISQFFENSLSESRWHQDLLDKMTLDIEGTRPRVLSDTAHSALRELMRFRHFKRYYVEFDYDWDRLQFLQLKLSTARLQVRADLDSFVAALKSAERRP